VATGHLSWAYFSLGGNAMALMAGAAAAVAGLQLSRWAAVVGGSALVGLSATAWDGAAFAGFVPPTVVIFAVLLVTGAPAFAPLAWSPLRAAGRVSYGWYLWHFPFTWLFPTIGWARWLGVALSLLLASASWRFLERPLLTKGRAPVETAAGPFPESDATGTVIP
jgi:peptidoglycan/LPS O-acetylase OafA/YrhL